MTFLLVNKYAYYAIVNHDARYIVGRAYPLRGRRDEYKISSGIGPSTHFS
jgi:hypothetical protein